MGWTDDEYLVCVLESGGVVVYNIHGDIVDKFALSKEVLDEGISFFFSSLFLLL